MSGVLHRLLAAGAVALAFAPAAQAEVLYRWTQYVPGGLEARAITQAKSCPSLKIDGRGSPMHVRADRNRDFPVIVCSGPIPAGARSAEVDGTAVPLPKPRANRILVLGDTGCRVTRLINQACNDPDAWPFAQAARAQAQARPDVILHVGDFVYREAPCRPLNGGCAGTPHGDTWEVWESDFFGPAKPLLATAPLIMVRGNHEECDRGGKGWSRTLDPYPLVSASGCLGLGAPFPVDLGGLTLVVMDVSTAGDGGGRTDQINRYRAQFDSLRRLVPKGPIWLAFHRPIWAAAAAALGFVTGENKTLARAARDTLPDRVEALLSGHIHTFQALGYDGGLPPQIVSGHSGAELHWTAPDEVKGLTIDGVRVVSGIGRAGVFGFVTLERDGASWRVENHSITGKVLDRCSFEARRLTCPDRYETN